jgi:hypothetical protein
MKCWVQLVDSSGASYKESSTTKITLDDAADVDDLRDAVKLKHPQIPATIGPAQLTVYATRADLDNVQPITRLSTPVQGFGLDEDRPVFAVVPDYTQQGTKALLTVLERYLDDTITFNEYRNTTLPAARYHSTLPYPSSSTPANPRSPNHIFEWVDFHKLVLQWVGENYQENELKRIKSPGFTDRFIYEEVPQLQPFVFDNLLNIAKPICNDVDFESWNIVDRSDPNIRGKPDFAILKHGKLAAIGEIKGKWTLPESDIVKVCLTSFLFLDLRH